MHHLWLTNYLHDSQLTGKPMPGPGGAPGPNVSGLPQPHGYPPGPGGMRPNYPGGGGMGGGVPGQQSISQQPSGQTPTLNQLLQSPGGANAGASGSTGGHRYPPPPAGYEHGSYPQNPPNHAKADYSQQGPTGWPPANRPPPNSYAHPPPPPFQQQPQQPMYRQVRTLQIIHYTVLYTHITHLSHK